jgi:hypothetical protein
MYKVSVAVGVAGYALVILEIAGCGMFLRSVFTPLFPFLLLWYGLYFGVLGRDCAEVAADRMVSHADCLTYMPAWVGSGLIIKSPKGLAESCL